MLVWDNGERVIVRMEMCPVKCLYLILSRIINTGKC